MKKFLCLFAVALTLAFFQASFLYAQTGLLPSALPSSTDPSKIGVIAAVQGQVELSRGGQVGHLAESGEAVFLGDIVATDEQGHLQLMLLDGTVFTVGPSSSIVIDRFIFDPDTHEGEIHAQALKGVFRFVTGKIARKKPSNMEISLPSGNIGIRGTIVAFEVIGTATTAILLGPGERNNAGLGPGGMSLNNPVDGNIVRRNVDRSGYGGDIDVGTAPRIYKIPETKIKEMQSRLQAPAESSKKKKSGNSGGVAGVSSSDPEDSGDDAGSGQSATEEAGQDTAGAIDELKDTASIESLSDKLQGKTNTAAQDAAEEVNQYADGPTTQAQLLAVDMGTFHYHQDNVPYFRDGVGQDGTYDIQVNIDFGARQIGGGASEVVFNGGQALIDPGAQIDILPNTFDQVATNAGGFAVFEQNNIAYNGPSFCNSQACVVGVTMKLENANGQIADQMKHEVKINNPNGGMTGGGQGIAERFDGLSS